MKELLTTARGSIYNPQFYRELLTKPFSYSLKYYSAFTLLLIVVLTIATSIPLIARANKVAREFPKKFFEYIPDQLEVTVTKGIVSTNVEEPFSFPVPTVFRESLDKEGITNLLVIDTLTPFSIAQFDDFKTLAWLGSSQWVYRDTNEGGLKIQPLDPKVSLVVNETKLRGYESTLSKYYRYIGPIIALIIFITLCFIYVGYLVYLLFGALLVFFMLKVMKSEVAYSKAYQIGLHAVTLPILLQVLFTLSGIPLFNIPFIPTLILLTIVYINFKDAPGAPLVVAG